jgi:hypothetical protein
VRIAVGMFRAQADAGQQVRDPGAPLGALSVVCTDSGSPTIALDRHAGFSEENGS